MTDTRDTAEATAIDLAHHLHRLQARIEAFTGDHYPGIRRQILEHATNYVHILHRRQPGNEELAQIIAGAIWGDQHPDRDWWATPLGRDIAWHIGYTQPVAPMWAAVAVVGYSRAGIYKLIASEELTATAGGITRASLLATVQRIEAGKGGK